MIQLGKIYATQRVEQTISDNIVFANELIKCINKHKANNYDKDSMKLISYYDTTEGKISIITDMQEETTNIFFDDERNNK